MLDVRAKARRLHHQVEGGLGLIIIDYLQLMRPEGRVESRVEQVGQISRGLKGLARELDVPVIAISQLSRAVEQRHEKKPVLSDLRESGQIEQDSDLVMFIYREEYYEKDSERPGRGGHHRRQAPQRPRRRGGPHVPQGVPEVHELCERAVRIVSEDAMSTDSQMQPRAAPLRSARRRVPVRAVRRLRVRVRRGHQHRIRLPMPARSALRSQRPAACRR